MAVNDLCQRWFQRTATYRHRGEREYFTPRLFDVASIADDTTAKSFVEQHHYSGSYPSAKHRYGMYRSGELVGVAVLSIPSQRRVLTIPFPALEPYVESVELGRLVLLDEVLANAETWFLARIFDDLAGRGVRGVVSFSDPYPRSDASGRTVKPGHVGIIYQAANATYTGRSTPRTLSILPDGTVVSDKTKQKIRYLASGDPERYRGARAEIARLVRFGAIPMEPHENPTAWLNRELHRVTRPMRHAGNLRYCFTLGDRRQRRGVALGLPSLPYLKLSECLI